MLSGVYSWEVLKLTPEELLDGDLIFAKSRNFRRFVAHVAWVYQDKLHHVNGSGLNIQTVEEFLSEYEQPYGEDNPEKLLQYVDRRNCLVQCRLKT